MTFENANISKEEYVAYRLGEIDWRYKPMSNCSSQWTIDRERNIHMRCVSRTVPPDMGPHDPFWLFYWKTDYVIVHVQVTEHASQSNGWVARTILTKLEIPMALKTHKQEIVNDIREAMQAYGTGGVHCIAENFQSNFSVAYGV